MMFRTKCLPAILVAAAMWGCSGSHGVVPAIERSASSAVSTQQASHGKVASKFGAARGRVLRDSDLDAYIDTPLSPSDRVMAHRLMAFMPPNQRGDFLYMTPDGRIVSNNSALLPYATIEHEAAPTNTGTAVAQPRPAKAPASYFSSCAPPDPASPSHGAYTRQVSQCGYATGWGFVYVPCGTTDLVNAGGAEAGTIYFEITGPSKSEVEGGMFTEDGETFDPYLRSSAYGANNGYETLNNSAARFTCDEQMLIVHGLTQGIGEFTEIGDAGAYNPQSVWQNSTEVTTVDPAWLFGPIPTDMAQPLSIDGAGYPAPCSGCSISKVTALSQPATTYYSDGSYFGVDVSGNNAIRWLQLAFGNWGSDCYDGTTLCTVYVSPFPSVYYGGEQDYPDADTSQSDLGPTGYGPYESVDGIAMPGGFYNPLVHRAADITLNEPLPPLPCTLDGQGLCAIQTATTRATCYTEVWDPKIEDYIEKPQLYIATTVYATYSSSALMGIATKTLTKESDGCAVNGTTWSPAEPSVAYSDTSLP